MDTRTLDLNLLRALDALLAEANVTKAATRLNISQPALSAQLSRLRDVFADPLLTPVQRGMQPTALGEQLRAPLRQALEQLGDVVANVSAFDPLQARMTLSIAASDYEQYALLMPFLIALRVRAPHIRVALIRLEGRTLAQQMEKGEVDIALMNPANAPQNLRSRHLHDERYVCIVRKRHPRVRTNLTLNLLASLEHIVVSPRGGGFTGHTDEALAAIGKQRHVQISASSFLWVPEMVERSDMVALVPFGMVADRQARLRIFEPPLPVAGFSISMLWHERTHNHKGYQWLREQLQAYSVSLGR
jgi:DNA-binding transcriptional LysR family regulator